MSQRLRSLLRPAMIVFAFTALAAFGSACATGNPCPNCGNIVNQVPWTAPESYTYKLTDGSDIKGKAVFSVTRDGDAFVLEQRYSDAQGNTDNSVVRVAADTLKPLSSRREITDAEQRRTAESTYDPVGTGTCGTGVVVNITQTTYNPPTKTTPDSSRSNPLCAPQAYYENDSSLFLWRSIKFEKGYTVDYRAVLSNRRTTQVITLTVKDQVKLPTAAGVVDAWQVDIRAQQTNQRAWFATTPDHRLLRYNNDSIVFDIVP
ncbi:MAG: hypothetical protein HYX50_04095 [Chloroflexi bacterium]|nr:hypothetical protein [Chloroflexota bacterium]